MSQVGPTVLIPDSQLDVFEMFSPYLLEKIVKESNRYAEQVMSDEQYRTWNEITVEEL